MSEKGCWLDNINQAVCRWKSPVKVYSLELSSLYSLPLWLFSSLGWNTIKIWVGWQGEEKWRRLQWFHHWLGFSFCSTILLCAISCAIKLTHSCCIFVYRGVLTLFSDLSRKNWKKLNRPARLSNEFESYRSCKRTWWFWRWRIKRLCVYSAFRTSDLIKARRPEEVGVIKYFEDNDSLVSEVS